MSTATKSPEATAAKCVVCGKPRADRARHEADFEAPGPSPADFCFAEIPGIACARGENARKEAASFRTRALAAEARLVTVAEEVRKEALFVLRARLDARSLRGGDPKNSGIRLGLGMAIDAVQSLSLSDLAPAKAEEAKARGAHCGDDCNADAIRSALRDRDEARHLAWDVGNEKDQLRAQLADLRDCGHSTDGDNGCGGCVACLKVRGDAALAARAQAQAERDLAIAHDRQPYPTAHAYEQVCAALQKSQAEAAALREALRGVLRWYASTACASEMPSTTHERAVVALSPAAGAKPEDANAKVALTEWGRLVQERDALRKALVLARRAFAQMGVTGDAPNAVRAALAPKDGGR